MAYSYIKALHIIFIVTWFSGMFYIVRLFIYNTEVNEKPEPERSILQHQFGIMIKRLWLGITWPSAIITLVLGPWLWYLRGVLEPWLMVKLCFVVGLYAYHFTLHLLYKQQATGRFNFSSTQLRVWNEVATIFLIAIIMLAAVKSGLSALWGLAGLIGLMIVLMSAIKIYKRLRNRANK